MASKSYIIKDEWKQVNKGGLISGDSCIVAIRGTGSLYFLTTENSDDDKDTKNAFLTKEGITYTGNEYLWTKSISSTHIPIVIDKL